MVLRAAPNQAPRQTAMIWMLFLRFHILLQSSDRKDACQRKLMCSLKIRSFRNIIVRVTAASSIERGHLLQSCETSKIDTYR